jgi:hypothetical protein
MTGVLQTFLDMDPNQQCLFQVGRRFGIFRHLIDMNSPRRLDRVEEICKKNGITPENADLVIDELMKRFI